jgi:hypothetical protein
MEFDVSMPTKRDSILIEVTLGNLFSIPLLVTGIFGISPITLAYHAGDGPGHL